MPLKRSDSSPSSSCDVTSTRRVTERTSRVRSPSDVAFRAPESCSRSCSSSVSKRARSAAIGRVIERMTQNASPAASSSAPAPTIAISRWPADALDFASATASPADLWTASSTARSAAAWRAASGMNVFTYRSREPSRSSTLLTVSWRESASALARVAP